MCARLLIDLNKIRENALAVNDICRSAGISITAVTKMHRADRKICKAILSSGIGILGDSRLQNLEKIAGLNCEKWLIRQPAISECREAVRLADVSLNSEMAVIKALDDEAGKAGRMHGVVLMFDLGDLREGYFYDEDILFAAGETLSLKNIRLCGIGTNLSCYGGVQPDYGNLSRLVSIAERIEAEFGLMLEYVSGGSSTSYSLIQKGDMPEGIDNLRIGDTILIGRDDITRETLPYLHDDCFVLECEIIEIKEKPSVPVGTIGLASLNRTVTFEDKGIRKRAICSIGRQDIDTDMVPLDSGACVMEASSDHLLVDITDSTIGYRVGDTMRLKLKYASAMRAFTSDYVIKEYI
ncbi:MAG: alanine/ornithine racemase family PLP-dependent enzyme [Eubacteriaceae bacterium]|nr:alanine/ornithine racemase family PLP-dependent enzyme [Eubacteriaceae bacterium]